MVAYLGDRCCGCGLCAALCPKQAISMKENNEGFFYPAVDENLCVSCGLCKKFCPAAEPLSGAEPRQVLAVKHGDEATRRESTSGGLFTLLSDEILSRGGAVYGAVLGEDGAKHIRATDTAGRNAMRGSKYIQSDMEGVYESLLADGKVGNPVLFSGTPCQCAAVDGFYRAKGLSREKLTLVEILCTGVNSPKFWKAYRDFRAEGAPAEVKFRSKVNGWKKETLEIRTEKGTYLGDYHTDPFCQCFAGSLTLRPACHSCPYARLPRVADVSMGDFWAFGKLPADFVDDGGISMALVNTPKGEALWEQVKDGCRFASSDVETAVSRQMPLKKPVWRNRDREAFWQCYEKHGLEVTLRRYTDYGTLTRLKKKAKAQVKKLLKR